MINIPWSIYKENQNTQWSDQWEIILFKDELEMNALNTSTFGNRLTSLIDNNGIRSWGTDKDSIAIPQSRITKLSFPMPFPTFNSKDLPNKMNVYNAAEFRNRDVTLNFTENTSFTGYKWFKTWFDEIYNADLRVFKPEAETKYRFASVVFKKKGLEYGSLIDKPSIRFNLYKLKLIGFTDNMDLDYSSGKPLEFNIKMKVEKVVSEDY